MFGTMLCLLGLGFSDTAAGQTIITTPPLSGGMTFQVQSGGAQAVQNLTVDSMPTAETVFVTVPSGQTWLKVNSNPGGTTFNVNTPSTLPVQVNTLGLTNGQTVSANILIAFNQSQNAPVSFPVSMTVGTPSLLTATPGNLTFSAVTGSPSGNPNSIPVTVTSSGQPLTYNVSAATTTGQNWLLLSNTLGIPTSSSTPGFSVSVNASTLASGSYSGQVVLQSTTTGDSTTIPVTLSVTSGAALNVTGTLNNFVFQFGSSIPPTQTQNLMISTLGGSLNYQVVATPVSGPSSTTNWLFVNPTGGLATTTPSTIALSLNQSTVTTLPVGTYVLNLAISPTASAGNTTNETVTLVVSNNPLLSVNNNQLSFTIPFGTTTSQSQQVQISSSNGASVPYTVLTSQSWLTTSVTSGNTAQNSVLTIFANASGLNVSTTPYTGTVTIFPANGDQYSLVINVSLTVTSATTSLFAAPAALLYSYQTTQSPPSLQLVQLSSPTTTGFTVSTTTQNASNCPTSSWLVATANQLTTPATLSVGVLTSGMTSGFCSGQVIVTYNNGAQNTSVNIPVFVNIAATPLLTVTPDPGFGVVTATVGTNSVLQSRILLGSTDGSALGYSAFASTPGAPVPWLSLGNSQGNTQQYVQVFILPSGLPVGVYTGSITITANAGATMPSGQLTIPVVLTISANTTVVASPASVSFTQSQGGTAPAAQSITLTASGGTTPFTASVTPVTGGSWLQVSPLSGNATGTITATVLANTLSVGTYTSNITVRFQNAATPTITIPVSLVITAAVPVITASPSSVSFTYQLGGTTPAAQQVNLTSSSAAVNVSVVATSTPAWLAVTPTTGTTPLSLSVSVLPSVLTTPGTLNGTITITPTGQAAITVPVTLTVTGTPAPQLVSISNSASGAFGVIAPGELITIKGINLGPVTPANFTVGAGGTLNSTLAGVQVMFDTIPGTPIYVSSTQINVIVPYEVAGRVTTNVSVSYLSQVSAVIPQNIANQAPGIYTDNSTGLGQASAVNQNGTLNGPPTGLVIGNTNIPTTPAAVGSVISVYMTGGGQTSPLSATGTVTPGGATLYKIPGTVTAIINGVSAPVLFAGAAPGEVTGVIQVNIQIPPGVSGTALPLTITINNSVSPSGTTVAVQ